MSGVRRGQRQRLPRLAHWRGEKVVYGRSETPEGNLTVLGMVDVVRVPPDNIEPLTKGRGRRPQSRRIKSESVPPGQSGLSGAGVQEEEWDSKTSSHGIVYSYTKETECRRKVASTRRMQKAERPESSAETNAPFQFQRLFKEADFSASGLLFIPVGATKPTKQSKDNSYVRLNFCLEVLQNTNLSLQRYEKAELLALRGRFPTFINVHPGFHGVGRESVSDDPQDYLCDRPSRHLPYPSR